MESFLLVVLSLQLLAMCQGLPSCGSEVTISPASAIVTLGSNATITCDKRNDSSIVQFSWNFIAANTNSIQVIFVNDAHRQPDGHVLRLFDITANQLGRYFCEGIETVAVSCISSNSTLTQFEPATISAAPNMYVRASGRSIEVTAVVTGNPIPTEIVLQKRNVQTRVYDNYPPAEYSVTDDYIITFSDLSVADSGQYRACVSNSHDAFVCANFNITVTGPPDIEPIPLTIVKCGGNFSVVCRVTQSLGNNFEIIWQSADGDELDDPLVEMTRLSANELRLFVERVTEPVGYMCIVRNSSGVITSEYVNVEVTDIPGPPRDLEVRSSGSDGDISVTWTPPETDNGSPLTAYYVKVTGEEINIVQRVLLDATSWEVAVGCKAISVTVTSENECGNSSIVNKDVDMSRLCDTAASESSGSNDTLPIIVGGVVVMVVFLLLTGLVIAIFIFCWKKQKRQQFKQTFISNVESGDVKVNSLKIMVTTSPPPLIKRTTSIRQYRSMLEVPRDNVTLRDVLCDGTYFELRKGLISISENENRTHEVMVKKAKSSAPLEEDHNIQEEIKMMSSLGIHDNVVGLLRTSLAESPAYLITEYFAHGDLLGFLRSSRGHYGMYMVSPGTSNKTHLCAIQGQDLLKIATQIAAGMNFLTEKKVAHRSLCARNVLVGTGLQVKVYNYGQKADSEATPHNYAKWMAPEMLFDGTANTMSDVWSFAVTLWEIVTIGGSPYPQTHPEQMRELLQTGHRMPKPDHCSDEVYGVMDQCWRMNPSMRPTFSAIHRQLDGMCKSKLSYLDSSLYDEREYSQFEMINQLMTAL